MGTFWLFLSSKTKPERNRANFYRIETFPYTYASEETKRNFCELFPNFFTSSERFCLLQAAQESKQNFCIFKKWYQNETKALQIVPGFSKDKTKLFVLPKKIWKRTRTKAFWPNFSNIDRKRFCFDPEFCFKNEHIRSFLEQKQQNESFRSWKNVGLTLLVCKRCCGSRCRSGLGSDSTFCLMPILRPTLKTMPS